MKTRFFDLVADPTELTDLAADTKHEESIRELTAAIHDWLAFANPGLSLAKKWDATQTRIFGAT